MAAVPAGGEIHQAQAGDRLVVTHVDGQAPCRPVDVDVHDVPASGHSGVERKRDDHRFRLRYCRLAQIDDVGLGDRIDMALNCQRFAVSGKPYRLEGGRQQSKEAICGRQL